MDRDAFAALKELSLAFVAEIEHVPADTAVKVVPETVQIEVVPEEYETAPMPEPPLVDSDAVPPTIIAETGLIVSVAWLTGVTTSGGFGKSALSPYSIR